MRTRASLPHADAADGGGGRELRHDAQRAVGHDGREPVGFVDDGADPEVGGFGDAAVDRRAKHTSFDLVLESLSPLRLSSPALPRAG